MKAQIMMKLIRFEESELINKGLSLKEAQAIVDAWDNYTEDRPVLLNKYNASFDFIKESVTSFMLTALFAAKDFQSRIFPDFDLTNEEDYTIVVQDMQRELKRNRVAQFNHQN